MPCEDYKNALIDAAATGTAPLPEVRAHLAVCASCRAAFAEEQAVFAGIDSSLHSAVNTEVPPSLLPRVRAQLDDAEVAPRLWSLGWMFVTAAAFSSVALFLAITLHQ